MHKHPTCVNLAKRARFPHARTEPGGSKLCARIRQGAYPVVEKSGILFAWLGRVTADTAPDGASILRG